MFTLKAKSRSKGVRAVNNEEGQVCSKDQGDDIGVKTDFWNKYKIGGSNGNSKDSSDS